jgi:hypothetical protein
VTQIKKCPVRGCTYMVDLDAIREPRHYFGHAPWANKGPHMGGGFLGDVEPHIVRSNELSAGLDNPVQSAQR